MRSYVFLLCGLLLSSCTGTGQNQKLKNFSARDQHGVKTSLNKARDGKPAVLYFYANCCAHCQQQLAAWSPFARQLEQKGIAIIGIQYFGNNTSCKLKIRDYQLVGTVFADDDGSICEGNGVGDFTYMLLDRGGIIRYRGDTNAAEIERLALAL